MRSALAAWLRLMRAFLHHGALLLAGRAVSKRPPTAHRGLFIHLFMLNMLTLALGSALRSWPLTVMQLVATVLLAALFLVACVRLCEYLCRYLAGSSALSDGASWLLLLTLLPATTIETISSALGASVSPLLTALALTRLPQQIRELQKLKDKDPSHDL